jgi:hypothetical protein
MSMRFKNKNIFGNTFNAYKIKAQGHILNMMITKRILPDGKITNGNLSELWSYIYFLFLFNKSHVIFKEMKGTRASKGNAKRFIKVVLEYTNKTKISKDVLKYFINDVITRHSPINPIINPNDEDSYTPVFESYNSPKKESVNHDKIIRDLVKLSKPASILKVKSVERIKSFLRKELDKNEKLADDIYEIISAIKAEKKTAASSSAVKSLVVTSPFAAKSMVKSSALTCQKELDHLLNIMIYGKMCILKYLGKILEHAENVNTNCADIDITKQKIVFKNLSDAVKKEYIKTYAKHRDSLLNYKESLPKLKDCTDLSKIQSDILEITQDLTNIYEDLFGSVRVFIRIRPLNRELDNLTDASRTEFKITDNTRIMMKCDKIAFKETEFNGCFDETFSINDIYAGKPNERDVPPYALSRTFKQLEDGYSIIMSAYGLSGSGKSGIFLGYNGNPGLLNYGFNDLKGVVSIELYQAFELYYSYVNPNELSLHNKIILLHDSTNDFAKDISKYGVNRQDILYEILRFKETRISSTEKIDEFLKDIIDLCHKNMRLHSRIKQTPLNNSSSRSHLFMVFKIMFKDSVGFFTLSDQAGFENAYSIYGQIFTKTNSLPYFLQQFDTNGNYKGANNINVGHFMNVSSFGIKNGKSLLIKGAEGKLLFETSVRPKIENTIAKNVQIIYESFSIVESLLHLKYFLNKRNNKNTVFYQQQIKKGDLQYDTTKCFKNPQYEDIYHSEYNKDRVSKSTCLMVPILNYLSDQKTMTKFVMFITLRKDKCEENKNSLEFAASIVK